MRPKILSMSLDKFELDKISSLSVVGSCEVLVSLIALVAVLVSPSLPEVLESVFYRSNSRP